MTDRVSKVVILVHLNTILLQARIKEYDDQGKLINEGECNNIQQIEIDQCRTTIPKPLDPKLITLVVNDSCHVTCKPPLLQVKGG